MKNLSDNDILKFFQGFKYRPTKAEIIQKYIEGRITKEEFMQQMEKANDWFSNKKFGKNTSRNSML